MSRRHRHHRKHRPSSISVSTAEQAPTQATTVSLVDNLGVVRYDLTRTAVLTSIFVIALVALSIVNIKRNWTLSLGSQLYTLLHIR